MGVLLGVLADDYTGATDIASVLVSAGLKVLLVNGIPEMSMDVSQVQVIVVALKIRSIATEVAVKQSLNAIKWLEGFEPEQYFFKYCSTFDSTAKGNIGPVADALQDYLKTDFSIVCPAFPENGRTVYKGHLFVFDKLLSDSPMKDHPLTPMKNSNLVELMREQSSKQVGLVNLQVVQKGLQEIKINIAELKKSNVAYAVVDAITDNDLVLIAQAIADQKLITGGSAVAGGLPGNYLVQGKVQQLSPTILPALQGRQLVLAGSCSVATRHQIQHVIDAGWPVFKLDVDAVANGKPVAEQAVEWLAAQSGDSPVLIFASADPEEVQAAQEKYGRERSGEMIEKVMQAIAEAAIDLGVRQLIVAGGETSGAVTQAINVCALHVGQQIDPGIPWTLTQSQTPFLLALKSGNFGSRDFFQKAFGMLQ